jgi:predicted metal-dependent phosphoesterase TrpH
VYTVDLHLHTRPFHNPRGAPTAFDPYGAKLMAATARNRGLDGLALTNHNYRVPYTNADPVFIPGIEVTTQHGHVLVVGPNPPNRTYGDEHHPSKVVEDAHDRGCAAIIAHPFRDSTVMRVDAPFDAVEINGKHPERKPNIDRIADERGIPVVGGSDAHVPFELGRVHTVVHADELTPESLVAAIKEGRVEPGRKQYLTDRILLPVYDAIHGVRDAANRALPS